MAKKVKSPTKVAVKKAKPTPAKKSSRGSGGGSLTSATRILQAIAARHSLGEEKADRKMVLGLATITNKKSFDTTIGYMKNKGLVAYDSLNIWLTEEGLKEVGPEAAAPPQNNDAMQAKLKETMVKGGRPRAIFDILTDGRSYSRAELAAKLNMEDNKSFATYVSALSKVTERIAGKIRLQDIAFPCGRPCTLE